jgi:hypothetical protein
MGDEPQQVVQMSQQQFNTLLGALRPAQGAAAAQEGMAIGSAVAVGQLQPCNLGRDKVKRYKKWTDWHKQAKAKMSYLGITNNSQKVNYVKSCAGPELLTFWEKEARIRFENIEANEQLNVEAQAAHTYNELVLETEKVLLAIINRDRAVIDLLKIDQGNKTLMEFLAEVEDQAKLCRANEKRITEDDLVRMSLIRGFKDKNLAEKALAEEYDLKTTIQVAATRENSKANVAAMQAKNGGDSVRKVSRRSQSEDRSSGDDQGWVGDATGLRQLVDALDVMKVKQHGKYSRSYKEKTEGRGRTGSSGERGDRGDRPQKCRNCDLAHGRGECRAEGKHCYGCNGTGHYARAPACPGRGEGSRRGGAGAGRARRVDADTSDSESNGDRREQPDSERWPGVRDGGEERHGHLYRMQTGAAQRKEEKRDEQKRNEKKRDSRWITVWMQGRRIRMYADTGSDYTILPPEMYRPEMGELVAAKRKLRGWGAADDLDVKGMFRTEIVTKKGARRRSWVYVVGGHRPEPLLGDKDAAALGIVEFRAEGRDPTKAELCCRVQGGRTEAATRSGGRASIPSGGETGGDRRAEPAGARIIPCTVETRAATGAGSGPGMGSDSSVLAAAARIPQHAGRREEAAAGPASIPAKMRESGMDVTTGRKKGAKITSADKDRAWAIVKNFQGTVFRPGIGLIDMEPITLEHEDNFRPVQPPRHPVPYHYRDRLSKHLDMMRKEGAIEDVDPREPVDAVLNVVITDKKTEGEIRMNIDAVPLNKGARMTKFHVKTAAEVRHELEGAAYFSEFDMGYGYHQCPISAKTQKMSVFQSHEGLHRMTRLYFGPKAATGIFHNAVMGCFRGLEGVTSIHDNILVHGATPEEHHTNLKNMLERAQQKGIRLKLGKSTIFENKVDWFGRVFSATGVSASPDKIKAIIEAGRPESTEDVRSLLQACGYNAKFTFDHDEKDTYSEITAPLREMTRKGEVFHWTQEREEAYKKLVRIMSDQTTLRAFNPKRETHFISDASPKGLAASIYQRREDGVLVPVDHVDRAMSATEQGWRSQIEWESLAKAWGMTMLRPYLVGKHFTSWGDHKPLVSLYNDLTTPSSIRLNSHRQRVQDLSFTDKHLPGRDNPCDYKSRKCASIEGLSPIDREKLDVDDNAEVMVMRIQMDDAPPALTIELIKEAAEGDATYQEIKEAVLAGRKPHRSDLKPYTNVWKELCVVNGLLLREDRIIIPDGDLGSNEGSMRQWCVELGHEGHQGEGACKRYLRTRLWWPGMDRLAEARVKECMPCQASVDTPHRDPLQPTTAPRAPMEKQSGDHWGPTPDGRHVLVVMDLLTRYPEVAIVDGTSVEANIHALDDIFSRRDMPKVFLTDGGPPWNTGYDNPLQRYFRQMGIEHRTTRSADDPEANGVCEAFMKHLKKIWHTSLAEYKDPIMEVNKHLRAYRATPHPTTKAAPGELLYARTIRTKLPDMRENPAWSDPRIKKAREEDAKAKAKMKEYKDSKPGVKAHNIQVGDKVLKRQQATKQDPPYDPDQFTVTEVVGTQIEARRGDEVVRRDAQKWKKVRCEAPRRFHLPKPAAQTEEDADIGPLWRPTQVAAPQPPQVGENPPDRLEPRDQARAARPDIRARLARDPLVIIANTATNRPSRARKQTVRYEAEPPPRTRGKRKTAK